MENKIMIPHSNGSKIAATRADVANIIIVCFKCPMGQASDPITEDSVITDAFPDMDHLDRISIMMEIEREFVVIIKDEDIIYPQEDNGYQFQFKLKTIKEFVDLVIEKLNAKEGNLNLEISE